MSKVFFLLFLYSLSFGTSNNFLQPKDAFAADVKSNSQYVIFNIKLDKSIYIYDEFLKVVLKTSKDIDITKELNMPKPINYHDSLVHFGDIKIQIPFDLISQKTDGSYKIELQYQGCSKKGLCYSPLFLIYDSAKENFNNNESSIIESTLKNGNLLLILSTFFGFGLLLALTPCIFPMIPILSGLIVQQSKKDDKPMSASYGLFLSLIYVLSMSVAYTIAGVLAGLFGANLQITLQDPVVISIFAILFVILSFSMFGYFDIALPKKWQTALDKTNKNNSKNSGILGIAIMGFLSALIVGPCVAPPLAGALVYIGQTGDALLGGYALFVMSLGMGVPLLLIGAGAGKYMPKPGGWMTMVSKIFGIVMLGVALWMLSKIIGETTLIYLSSFLLIGTAIYMQEFRHIMTRLVSTIILVYGIVLFIGAISGATNLLEPLIKFQNNKIISEKNNHLHISTVEELNNILTTSKKPVIIDFWARWCVSCVELDNTTFKDERIKNKLKNYTFVKIDITNNTKDDQKLMKKFNLFGPPALIFFKNNKEIKAKRVIGYKNPNDFLLLL